MKSCRLVRVLLLMAALSSAIIYAETPQESSPETPAEKTTSALQVEPSHFSVPEWLYSYNLGIMRVGFYNKKPGGLLEIGICNNGSYTYYHDNFFELPDTLFQIGAVNCGEDWATIRIGLVNCADNVYHKSIMNIGLVNCSPAWQIGLVGYTRRETLQTNLINCGNSGGNGKWGFQIGGINWGRGQYSQLGLANVQSAGVGGQCGLMNITYDRYNIHSQQDIWQFGLLNLGIHRKPNLGYQFGLVNIGDYNMGGVGILNIRNRFPFITLIFWPPRFHIPI